MTQEEKVLFQLRMGIKTTRDFCLMPDLSAEYRRAISVLRKRGYQIVAERRRRGLWSYKLVSEPGRFSVEDNGQMKFA